LQEIERDLKRDKDQQQQQEEVRTLINELQYQRKLTTPIHSEEDKIYQARLLLAESNKQIVKILDLKKKESRFFQFEFSMKMSCKVHEDN